MKKPVIFLTCCVCMILLLGSENAIAERENSFSLLWVMVTQDHLSDERGAYVEAVTEKGDIRYELSYIGVGDYEEQTWGYYEGTVRPGTYKIYINGKPYRAYVEAECLETITMSSYWYMLARCYTSDETAKPAF
ncbi:hypothetical protein QUF80_06755 [Desulfococcaceae bacterium HSG8]|nr:hypothetical protein [Desulfococcaceae bacterium HSG8]